MATHAPILMAYPNARLLRLGKYGLAPVRLEETDHFRLLREFCADPALFLDTMLADEATD
jgi:predicted ATPase